MPILKLLFTSKWEITSSSVGKRPKRSNLLFFFMPSWDIKIEQNIDYLLTNTPSFNCYRDLHVPAWKSPVFPRALELHFPWLSSSKWPELSPGSQITHHTWHFLAATKGAKQVTHTGGCHNQPWDFPSGNLSDSSRFSHNKRITGLSSKNSKNYLIRL